MALRRSDVPIGEYQAEVSMYNSSSFIFVDETGCDRRGAIEDMDILWVVTQRQVPGFYVEGQDIQPWV